MSKPHLSWEPAGISSRSLALFSEPLLSCYQSTTKPGAGTCLARGGGVRMRCGGCLCANRTAAGSVNRWSGLHIAAQVRRPLKMRSLHQETDNPTFAGAAGLSAALRPRSCPQAERTRYIAAADSGRLDIPSGLGGIKKWTNTT